MSTLPHKPCAACPYRKDAPRGFWDPSHFADVIAQDHDVGHAFGCHLGPVDGKQDSCIGWLADQKRRNVPNIGTRLRIITSADERDRFERIDENDPNLYQSIAAMVRANRGRRFPKRDAKARGLLGISRSETTSGGC